jgi:hypothetical protein
MIGFEGARGLPSLDLGCMRDAEALFELVGDFDQVGIARRTLLHECQVSAVFRRAQWPDVQVVHR